MEPMEEEKRRGEGRLDETAVVRRSLRVREKGRKKGKRSNEGRGEKSP